MIQICSFFFLNDTAPPEIYPLSLHDALPISRHARARDVEALLPPLQLPAVLGRRGRLHARAEAPRHRPRRARRARARDRKSTRLNSSHANISYAVFCLKKKKTQTLQPLKHDR